uniref:tryptophan synthase alpha subunit n=1 Tax=Gloiopeltis furcata TaxID=42017 RepID=UPI0028D2573E|nr:tryptophan synthase alpha subunit [Gloiopeltis furcata]WMP13841.1 tryptophan synthase alpha subunit [Gloiopeltis furcata]
MAVISETLRNKNSTCALIPFITAGFPDLSSTIKALFTLDANGADIIELGIPYADALADGPIIQESSRVALGQGVYIDQILTMLSQVSSRLNAPVIIFTYYNPILVKGVSTFIAQIANSGASGLIVPDLPLEEADYLTELCNKFHIELILFIAPSSSPTRIQSIVSKSPGCLYLVSSYGVTGLRTNLNYEINELAKEVKSKTDKLVILGFGISDAEQAAKVSQWDIDGIVIGSAFIRSMSNNNESDAINSLGSFCRAVKNAINT